LLKKIITYTVPIRGDMFYDVTSGSKGFRLLHAIAQNKLVIVS